MIPSQVDCIILGTGLTNSIVAAAFSRIGKSVLHIDKNNYYGDQWASFTLQQLIDYIKDHHNPNHDSLKGLDSNDRFQDILKKSRMFCIDLCPRLLFSNGSMVKLLVNSNVTRYHDFKNNIRILSMVNGNEIHTIPCQRSDVFNSPILSDLVDKRKLMKFVELCLEFEPETLTPETSDIVINANKPFIEFLGKRGLSSTIKEYLINSIAMVEPNETTKKACENIKNFMHATQRYGRSPFLFPLYGSGEFPQSFCRLSAVFGGVYCLNTQIDNVRIESAQEHVPSLTKNPITKEGDKLEDDCDKESLTLLNKTTPPAKKFQVQLLEKEQKVMSDMLVIDYSFAIELNLTNLPPPETTTGSTVEVTSNIKSQTKVERVARAVLITDKSILVPNDENLISFMRIPPSENNANVIFLLEVNSSVMVCPPNVNIIYLWTKALSSSNSAEDELMPIVKKIFSQNSKTDNNDVKVNKDKDESIIWEFYYHQPTTSKSSDKDNYFLIKKDEVIGLQITEPPSDDIDYNYSIREAEQIFKKLCPEDEFLPRAPDPDEIIS